MRQEEFGRQEVVEYLKEVQEQRALLRKLQHLQAQIAEQHAERCDEVRACQINRVRQQRLEAIEAGTPRFAAQQRQHGEACGATRGREQILVRTTSRLRENIE